MNEAHQSTIYADGENLIVFFKNGQSELAYTFKSPIIQDISIDQPNTPEELVSELGKSKDVWIPMAPPNTEFSIQGMCAGENTRIESSEDGGLIPKLGIFNKVSVSDLFRVINKKLNKREKDGKG